MVASQESGNDLNDPRTALAAGVTHWVGRVMNSALMAYRGKGKGTQAAGGPAPNATQGDPARPTDEWGWLASRRKAVGTELNHPPEPTLNHCL